MHLPRTDWTEPLLRVQRPYRRYRKKVGLPAHELARLKKSCRLLGARVINPLAPVDRFYRNQYAHLRSDLNHPSTSHQARSRLAQSGGTVAFHWMRILAPREDSNSITHSSSFPGVGATSSTNAGLADFRRLPGDPPSLLFSPM
jgi:hypothetical protein